MSSVSLKAPRKYSREIMLLVGGGALAGVVATLLNAIAGASEPALFALSFGGIVGLLTNLTDPREGTPALRLVLAIIGGASMALLLAVNSFAAAAALGLFIGMSLSLDHGDSSAERAFVVVMHALALVPAAFVVEVLAPMIPTELAQLVFSGGVFGVFLSFASGLKRVDWQRDELLAEFKDAYADLRGEERETIRSGRIIYEQIVRELERAEQQTRDRAADIASETGHALIAITRRSQQLRSAVEKTGHRQLQSRIAEIDRRIEEARDATVERELRATLKELAEQVKARRRFDVARARLEARQQRCFTALERLHVSLVQASAGDDAGVIESIESLERISDEIRWRNLSVDELVGDEVEPEASEADVDEILADARAGVVLDGADSDSTEEGTVLDTGAAEDESPTDEPPGTDGSVEVSERESAHVVDSR